MKLESTLYNYDDSPGTCSTMAGASGGTINYSPFSPGDDDACALAYSAYSNVQVISVGDGFSPFSAQRLPLPPYYVVAGQFIRSYLGGTLSGYSINSNGNLESLEPNPVVHTYVIDKNVDLNIINHSEMVIYNPSEAKITADNLHFPSNYTFKTIRGTYPFEADVATANNSDNGGPYNNTRDVPVNTDLEKDYHISGYQTGDPKYSSIYHLESGSKLTIEPCVHLFDCTFEVNPGSEIVFENTQTNLNKQRYQLLYAGGTVTERDEQWLFQNKTETRKILNYEAEDLIEAGAHVDNNQTQGAYIVDAGADVTFAASNQIVLKDGFRANAGSKFHAYITPVTVPGCPARMARPDTNTEVQIDKPKHDGQFFLAPSLTTSRSSLNFKILKEGYYSVEVLNTLGETQKKLFDNNFFRANSYKLDEDFTDLAPGVYICKLSNQNEQFTTKFIKSN